MQIPTIEQCYHLMSEMKMMDHIVAHSMQVCRVATFLTDHLKEQQNHLNFNLIRAAALLHDITKTRSFNTDENHALTGDQVLTDRGYPEIGDLVRQHVVMDAYRTGKIVREVEIINYADKRVLHDKIVSLDKRLEYILERYAQNPADRERIDLLWHKTKRLEDRIFNDLPFTPEDLNRLINSGDRSVDLLELQQICQSVLKNPSAD
jgi:putative nucleotidyltransferase with HDIG domain